MNASILNLTDIQGEYTGVSFILSEGFNSRNLNGPKATITDLNMPDVVSSDSYYGSSLGVWQGKEVKRSVVKIQGLDKTKKYNCCFFGSRPGSQNENRETKLIVKGENEAVAYFDAAREYIKNWLCQ